MARRPRLQYPGAIYHAMSRGNRKLPIFEDDCDRECLLEILSYTAKRYGIRCYALCFMSNHYHLVFDTPRGNLSDAMRQVNGLYTQAYNRRHRVTGHLFQGRFRSIVVQGTLYLRRVARYVVLNPTRARLVASASDWRWSSHRATLGLDPVPSFLPTGLISRSQASRVTNPDAGTKPSSTVRSRSDRASTSTHRFWDRRGSSPQFASWSSIRAPRPAFFADTSGQKESDANPLIHEAV
jgi:putative transposase